MRKIKVFLVDDEIMAVRHFCRMLKEDSNMYEFVGFAENGAKALKDIAAIQPDVVFADVQMPVMTGLELAEKIKETYPSIRVVLLTAYKDFEYAQRGINAGVMAYLVKHEVNGSCVEKIIERIRGEIETEEIQRRIWLEKNMRDFLEGSTEQQRMGLGYSNYNFLLLDIVTQMPVCLEERLCENTDLPVQALEGQMKTEDIFCKIALKMTETTYAVLLFLKKGINEKSYYFQLHSILNISRKFFNDNGMSTIVIVPAVVGKFGELPEVYRKQRQHEPYVYSSKNKIIHCEEKPQEENSYIEFLNIRNRIYREEMTANEKMDSIKKIFAKGHRVCTFNQYIEELNNLAIHIISEGEKINLPETAEWEEGRKNLFPSVEAAEKYLLDIAGICFSKAQKKQQNSYSELVSRAVSFMETEYAKPLTSMDICVYLGISESHFRRVFKQEVGIKPMEYLNTYRIEVAKVLLKDNRCHIQEIFERVGFSSSQYFSTVFKKITGISPGQYQQKKRKE